MFCVLHLYNPKTNKTIYLFTEKGPSINWVEVNYNDYFDKGIQTIEYALPKPIYFKDLIMKTQMILGSNFNAYTSYQYNCQNYVLNLVLSAFMLLNLKLPEFIIQWIYQDPLKIFDKINQPVKSFSDIVTSLGALAERFIGRGKKMFL